jgi:type II secretory pathway component PulF
MLAFRYQALNSDQQLVDGELTADSVDAAIAQLRGAGLDLQSISLVSQSPASAILTTAPIDSSDVERSAILAHMHRVIEQSKPITPALRAYAEEMPRGRRRRQLSAVIDVLERGDAAAATAALAALPEYWVPLLSAATLSRDPERVLREFVAESRRADELRRQWRLALAYPLFIAAFALAVLVALSFIFIPIFRALFSDWGLQLPTITRVIMELASAITNGQTLIFLLGCVGLGALLWYGRRFVPESLRSSIADRFSPLFVRQMAIARFAHFTADLLEGGLALPDALRVAGHTTRKQSLRIAAWRLAHEMARGTFQQLSSSPLTATVSHALITDLSTPSRIHLLREISNCHADRARIRLSWTRGFIEPVGICIVGGLVGLVVVALFLPLVSLVDALSR